MPRKTRKRPTSKKAKTKAKTTAKIYKNKNVSQKVFKQIYKKTARGIKQNTVTNLCKKSNIKKYMKPLDGTNK